MIARASFASILFVTLAATAAFAQPTGKPTAKATPAPATTVVAPPPPFYNPSAALWPRWAAGFSFQSVTGTKGFGIEVTTPSYVYGKATLRAAFHRNHIQSYNVDTAAANPNTDLEYYAFNILSFNVLIPERSGLDRLVPYYGGGINFVILPGTVSDSKTQVNLGLVGGVSLGLDNSRGGDSNWTMFSEFGYNTENVEANKLIGKPQIADGFVARGGFRRLF